MIEITHGRAADPRGFFAETYREDLFSAAGVPSAGRFVQHNHTGSRRGVLRGLHYQIPPRAQGKLVRCLRGSIFDVALDLRRTSPQFGRWHSWELGEDKGLMLYIPPGFAHGFQVLSDWAEVAYSVTDYYSPEHERGIRWDDADLAIPWPSRRPLLTPKDGAYPGWREMERAF